MGDTLTTIEISKEYLHFAAAHFTIFGPNDRENLHGHNFHVTLDATARVGDDGLTFDYNILKRSLKTLCDELDEHVLMPERSPYLGFEAGDDYTYVLFGQERIPFLARDLIILPIRNITVEEMAHYFLERLRADEAISALAIDSLHLRCSSGAGQWASARWHSQENRGRSNKGTHP